MKICSACRRCYEDAVLSCVEENHDSLVEARPGGREIADNYRLDFLLECDAISETYAATDIALDQPCAVTTIDANLTGAARQLREQFQNEARIAATVEHPNVVRVYESGVLDSSEFYLATELIEGQTLREYLNSGGAPAENNAVKIARQTAEALQAAHAAGVQHRNLNPTNIILTPDSENGLVVKIQNFDFGSVRQAAASAVFDSEPHLNWLRYASPEQCAAQTIDARSDIYSLGVVLYEMLGGRAPFDAPDAAELIRQQVNEPPAPVKISNFDIRALLTHALMQALQKSPARRLQTANAFARQLRHIEQLITRPPMPVQVFEKIPAPSATFSNVPPGQGSAAAAKFGNSLLEKIQPSVAKSSETAWLIRAEAEETDLLVETVQEVGTVEIVSPAQPELISVEQKKAGDFQSAPEFGSAENKLTEDVPFERETIRVEGKEFGYDQLTVEPFSPDDESVINSSEPESLNSPAPRIEQTPAHQSARGNSSLSSAGRNSRQSMMPSRPILAGAGLALLISAIIGVALNEKFQPSAAQPAIAAAPVQESASAPEPEEPSLNASKNIAETEKSETEEPEIEEPEAEEPAESKLEKYTPVKYEKPVPAIPSRSGKSEPSKEKTANPTKAEQNTPLNKKLAPEENVNKTKAKQNTPLNKKPALKKQTPAPVEELDIFRRPRTVKEGGARGKN